MRYAAAFLGVVVATLLTIAMLTTAGWVHPPILGTQVGFRGVALNQLTTPAAVVKREAAQVLPTEITQPPADDSPKVSEVYQNVQVLKGLTAVQFNTLMAAITTWVAPNDGCAYCHNPDNLADDGKYTKKVARRMIQMVQTINTDWKAHVVATGVVCWTCHRGNPVPKYTWTNGEGYPQAGGFATTNRGMGHPSWANGSTSLLQDPYGPLDSKAPIVNVRVQPTTALPLNSNGPSYQDAENTYSLMIAMSKGLGVNCTFCHNSRAFWNWEESLPQRVTAWHGMQMANALNVSYLDPLKAVLPVERLGKLGDAPKANCMTCHQGANKPLLGVSLAKDWPVLGGTAK